MMRTLVMLLLAGLGPWGWVSVVSGQSPVAAAPAAAQAETPMTADEQRLWQRHHRRFASQFIAFEDGYVACPTYNPRYPSSLGKTVPEVNREMSEEVRVQIGVNMSQRRTIRPPEPEVQAVAMVLPDMEVGAYGYIHSVRIREILGEDEMLVSDVWLIDATQLRRDKDAALRSMPPDVDRATATARVEQMFRHREELAQRQRDRVYRDTIRLKGFPTKGLVERDRWSGPPGSGQGVQIALVRREALRTSRFASRTNTRLVAIPAEQFRQGIDEAQFKQALQQRGLTPAQFTELVVQQMRDHRDDADRRVFLELQKRADQAEQDKDQAAG